MDDFFKKQSAREELGTSIDNFDGVHTYIPKNDGIIDVIVHSDGKRFIVEGKPLTAEQFTNYLKSQVDGNNLPIRLLSCNDIETAKEFAKLFPDREVIATHGKLKLFSNGHIQAIADGAENTKWQHITYKEKDGVGEFHTSESVISKKAGEGDGIELGLFSASLKTKMEWVDHVRKYLPEEQRKILDENFPKSLETKIKKAKRTKNISEYEAVVYEVMEWTRQNIKGNFLSFSKDGEWKKMMRCWSWTANMRRSNPKINVLLGSRQGGLPAYTTRLKASYFEDFHRYGLIIEPDEPIRNMKDKNKWLPHVSKAIKRSYDNGGKVFFQLNQLDNLDALYNPKSNFFSGGTLTEIRYVVDNGLWDKGLVKFWLGEREVTASKLLEIEDAINKWKIYRDSNPTKRSFKNWGGISFD